MSLLIKSSIIFLVIMMLSTSVVISDEKFGPVVATLDQESLFRNSLFGQRVYKEIANKSEILLANELLLQSELEAEERSLTKKRQEIDTEEFKKLAVKFDEKVQKIRLETTEKRIELNGYSESERNRFFEIIIPILIQLSKDYGITTLLDHRMAILSLNDLTEVTIKRVDKAIGEGNVKVDE